MLRYPYSMNIVTIDAGTTNTRSSLWIDGKLAAKVQVEVGVRDTAINGNNHALKHAVRDTINGALAKGGVAASDVALTLASGMITSALGLLEVPHLPAPASSRKPAGAGRCGSGDAGSVFAANLAGARRAQPQGAGRPAQRRGDGHDAWRRDRGDRPADTLEPRRPRPAHHAGFAHQAGQRGRAAPYLRLRHHHRRRTAAGD